jgi:hypothetical protein
VWAGDPPADDDDEAAAISNLALRARKPPQYVDAARWFSSCLPLPFPCLPLGLDSWSILWLGRARRQRYSWILDLNLDSHADSAAPVYNRPCLLWFPSTLPPFHNLALSPQKGDDKKRGEAAVRRGRRLVRGGALEERVPVWDDSCMTLSSLVSNGLYNNHPPCSPSQFFYLSSLSISLPIPMYIYRERERQPACVNRSMQEQCAATFPPLGWASSLSHSIARPRPSRARIEPSQGHAAHPERRRRACVRTYVRGARRIGGAVDGGGVGGCPSLVSCLPAAARLVGGIVCCCFRRSCFLARIDFATGVIRCGQPGTSWKCAIIN